MATIEISVAEAEFIRHVLLTAKTVFERKAADPEKNLYYRTANRGYVDDVMVLWYKFYIEGERAEEVKEEHK